MDSLIAIVLSMLGNALVTWGVMRTELKYLRRDVDYANRRIDDHFLDYPHEERRKTKCETNYA